MSRSPVNWPIDSGNVPERDVEDSNLPPPAHIINAMQPLRCHTNTHTIATTLTPSTRKQAHKLWSPVMWPIDSGNVPERNVENRPLTSHIINATQPL
eukprot:COSAG02_NODE_3404_length_6797_cov_54.443267_4_plen_97_part_00